MRNTGTATSSKTMLELPGYRVQALLTNPPTSMDAPGVWRATFPACGGVESGTGQTDAETAVLCKKFSGEGIVIRKL
jgi:hypothetical protein